MFMRCVCPFKLQTDISLLFEWFRNSMGHYSDPHFIQVSLDFKYYDVRPIMWQKFAVSGNTEQAWTVLLLASRNVKKIGARKFKLS